MSVTTPSVPICPRLPDLLLPPHLCDALLYDVGDPGGGLLLTPITRTPPTLDLLDFVIVIRAAERLIVFLGL